jgi:hypothetical protein
MAIERRERGTNEGTVGLGFAPHSGWAVVVGVSAAERSFRLRIRERIELTDAREPESRQPYHTVEGWPLDRAATRLAAWAAVAEQMAVSAISRIVEQLEREGSRTVAVGILDSVGRRGSSLAQILASHALIHTADGDHIRSAIATASRRCGLRCVRVAAKDLQQRAGTITGNTDAELADLVKTAGREAGPPWTSDQKAAALLAWLVVRETGARC